MRQVTFNTRSNQPTIQQQESIQAKTTRKLRRYAVQHPRQYTLYVFAVGLLIGLLVLGWGLWPVQWVDATPAQLAEYDRNILLMTTSELFAFDNNTGKVQQALSYWHGEGYACELIPKVDFESQLRLMAMVFAMGEKC